MINLKELDELYRSNEGIKFDPVPYGTYWVKIYSLQRIYEPEKGRDRIRVVYQILNEGDYQNFGIRESFFLSENVKIETQVFQYGNIKKFFLTINPNIDFNFETMDQLEENLKLYMTSIHNVKFLIDYQIDSKGYGRVYIQKREAYVPEEDQNKEEFESYQNEMKKMGYY